jgi:aminomethyltransferase
MVPFAGWEMPVQYRSILEEHKVVRSAAGLFDVSHMGELTVRGRDARRFLNALVTNDVGKLYAGRALYSPMCRDDGGVVDDLIVYQRAEDDYLLCVNAGNIAGDLAWIRERSRGLDVAIENVSSAYGLLALQGPRAAAIVARLSDTPVGGLKSYHFEDGRIAGVPCLISRTGYTGEDGFEFYHDAAASEMLAGALLAEGRADGLELAGLGARDSLRLEAGYPLYGHELSLDISPIAAGLGWTVKLDKGADFVGRAALLAEKTRGAERKVIFFRTHDRRIVRAESPVLGGSGDVVGRVLSGTLSPLLNEAIGSALVAAPSCAGLLFADIRGTKIALSAVRPPFVELRRG